MGLFLYCSCSIRVKSKSKLSNKAHGSHEPQGILFKALLRIPNGPKYLMPNVFLSFIGINYLSFRVIVRKSVYGEVPTGKILLQAISEFHFVRPTLVGIPSFCAIWGHLYNRKPLVFRVRFDSHSSEVVLIERVRKGLLYILRLGVGGHVPVLRGASNDKVTYASTY